MTDSHRPQLSRAPRSAIAHALDSRRSSATKAWVWGAFQRAGSSMPAWADVGYSVHAASMSLAALWVAMRLELNDPYWAGSTVLIVAQATRPKGLLKGLNRVIGTVVGTFVGVALIGLAPQSWPGYLALQCVWLAACAFASCLFKDMQSYAAALSGYTALIVMLGSFGQPLSAFSVAVARGSDVVVGVALFMVTLGLVTPSNDSPALRKTLQGWVEDGLALASRLLRGEAGRADVADFLPRLADLDGSIEEASTDAPWIGHRRALLRGAILALADCVLDAAALRGIDPAAAAALADRIDGLQPRGIPYAARAHRRRRSAIRTSRTAPLPDPAEEMLDRARTALDGTAALRRDTLPLLADPVRRTLDYDVWGAAYGGFRALLGMGLACTIWVVTRWPGGSNFVEIVGILCCLMASKPAPISDARRFTAGTAIAAVVSLIVGFFILPLESGFGALALTLFPIAFLGALGVRSKAFAGYASPVNFFVMSLIGIENVMNYDPLIFFEAVEGTLAGAFFAILMFRLLPAPGPARARAGLHRRMRAGIVAGGPRDGRSRLLLIQRGATLLAEVPADEKLAVVDELFEAWRLRLPPGRGAPASRAAA